jgi:dimethylamine monooxygenase subunit A
VFQIDDEYLTYINNKKACREEGIGKYYLEEGLYEDTAKSVNNYLLQQLLKEHPSQFLINNRCLQNNLTGESLNLDEGDRLDRRYTSVFDAICSQLQEDVAVFQLDDDSDWLAAIHLCAPNHWSPADKIGMPFSRVHQPVPDMENTIKRYPIMLKSIVERGGPYTRFAWGISTDTRLNHHPLAPVGIDASEWHGRKASAEVEYFIRTERQNLIGLPGVGAFIFTIRTYFYPFAELEAHEKAALSSAIGSMSEATLAYKGLDDKKEYLIQLLSK